MQYTIAQVAERYGVSTHTLRYYDKEGLLPFVDRTESGIRNFKESDFEWLSIITCLKETGMPVKKIKEFIDLCMQGQRSVDKRLNLFKEQKQEVEEQIKTLQKHLDKINFKIWYYSTAQKEGLEAVHKKKKYRDEVKKDIEAKTKILTKMAK
ncbi:DNA-binding transcriptional MerR regulator [Elusimicrobium simillimum]|uniref:MerR family transcriptional regulator n=1 Tax=Elusimicrobium simillimum TaxID=3143438 RepID=UPI003C6EE925